jgi:hypothetical protein
MRIYFSATLRYASAMSRPNFTEVYYFSHAVLLPPDGATITIIPFLKTSPFLYVLFCWSQVASHPPMLAMKTFPFTSEMFYSCSLATATLASYAILSGQSRTASTVLRVYATISFDSWSLLDLSSLDCTVCARTHLCRLKLIRVAPNTSALMTVAVASLTLDETRHDLYVCMVNQRTPF